MSRVATVDALDLWVGIDDEVWKFGDLTVASVLAHLMREAEAEVVMSLGNLYVRFLEQSFWEDFHYFFIIQQVWARNQIISM